MASAAERLRGFIDDIVEDGFAGLRYPVATTLQWWLGLTLLGDDPGPAIAAFREQRGRVAAENNAWKGLVEANACAAGSVMLGEPTEPWVESGVAYLEKLAVDPGFHSEADIAELGLGLALVAGDQEGIRDFREERMKHSNDASGSTESFERLYLTRPAPPPDVEAVAWSGYRAIWSSLAGPFAELCSPTVGALLPRVGRGPEIVPLLAGHMLEDDRRTHLGGKEHGPRLSFTPQGISVEDGPDGLVATVTVAAEGKGKLDGAYEACPALTAGLVETLDELSGALKGKEKRLFEQAMKAGGRLDAALRPAKGVHMEAADLQVLSGRFETAVEHGRHCKGWDVSAGALHRAR